MGIYVGFDIGGTKCAAVTGIEEDGELTILCREAFATPADQQEALDRLCALAEKLAGGQEILGIGISSGGPMDADKGELCNPPNLPGWHGISLTDYAQQRLHAPALLENDANACALAEWQFGAGAGTRNMIFLTFGTGLGAGLILDGRIYTGTNDNAGELGHIRLSDFGPVGYGKCGSFEGFCSGGGIRQLAQFAVKERLQMGEKVAWCPEGDPERIDARLVAQAAAEGDVLALEIYRTSARYLGRGLSIVIDLINPEMIVIGSIYARNENLMKPYTEEVIAREALSHARRVCRVVPAALGEAIGDYAALSVAANA